LNIAGNNISQLEVASVQQSGIRGLNLSGLKFKEKQLIEMLQALTKSDLKTLVLDNIFPKGAPPGVGEALCELVTANSSLRTLSIAGFGRMAGMLSFNISPINVH